MGFRFRKSIRIIPGVRVNLSRSGVGTSLGSRGATVAVSKRGMRGTFGIPGSGLSWSQSLFGRRGPGRPAAPAPASGNRNVGCLALIGLAAALSFCMAKNGRNPLPGAELNVASNQAARESPNTRTAYVEPAQANCRSGPSASAPVVAKLGGGEAVGIVETSGGWSRVERPGSGCWVSEPLLTDLPPAAPAAAPGRADRQGASTAPAAFSSAGRSSRAPTRARQSPATSGGCPCSSRRVCIGPRGGRYCITSGGNKRYGV